MKSFRAFSTVHEGLAPELFHDLSGLESKAHGKRLVYLAQLGTLLEKAMKLNGDKLIDLVFLDGHDSSVVPQTKTPKTKSAPSKKAADQSNVEVQSGQSIEPIQQFTL